MSSRPLTKLNVQRHQPRPWDRQSNETEGDHELFLTYRSMETRNYAALAARHDIPSMAIAMLAQENRWEERLVAEEMKKAEAQLPKVELVPSKTADLSSMRQKHMHIAEASLSVAHKGFLLLERYIKEEMARQSSGRKPGSRLGITADQIVKLADFGTKLQRLTMGEASSIVETKKDLDLTKLSDEELSRFKKLMSKAAPPEDK